MDCVPVSDFLHIFAVCLLASVFVVSSIIYSFFKNYIELEVYRWCRDFHHELSDSKSSGDIK